MRGVGLLDQQSNNRIHMTIISYLLFIGFLTAGLFAIYSLLHRWLRAPVRVTGERTKRHNNSQDNQTSRARRDTKSEQRPRGVPLFRNEAVGSGPNQLRVEFGSEPGRRSRLGL